MGGKFRNTPSRLHDATPPSITCLNTNSPAKKVFFLFAWALPLNLHLIVNGYELRALDSSSVPNVSTANLFYLSKQHVKRSAKNAFFVQMTKSGPRMFAIGLYISYVVSTTAWYYCHLQYERVGISTLMTESVECLTPGSVGPE